MIPTRAPTAPPAPSPTAPGARSIASPPVLLALFMVLAGLLAGGLLLAPQPPSEGSASVGFARDMSRHHGQAVAMAEVLRDRTDDPELRSLTQDIALTQQAQIGMMTAWLDEWGYVPTASGSRMAWTGSPVDGLMPGMATAEQARSLATLPLDQAEDRFLSLMVAHHTAGVAMAEAAVELSEDPQVVALASGIAAAQTSEIDYLQALRAQRGLPSATVPTSMAEHDLAVDHRAGGLASRFVALWSIVALSVVAFLWLLVDTVVRRSDTTQVRVDAAALLVVAGAVVSSAVHLMLTPSHAEESVAYGLFFLVAALALALGAAAVLAGSVIPGAAIVAVTSLLLLGIYVLFRVVPAPGAEAPEGIDGWGVLAGSAQGVAVLAASALVRRRRALQTS